MKFAAFDHFLGEKIEKSRKKTHFHTLPHLFRSLASIELLSAMCNAELTVMQIWEFWTPGRLFGEKMRFPPPDDLGGDTFSHELATGELNSHLTGKTNATF